MNKNQVKSKSEILKEIIGKELGKPERQALLEMICNCGHLEISHEFYGNLLSGHCEEEHCRCPVYNNISIWILPLLELIECYE